MINPDQLGVDESIRDIQEEIEQEEADRIRRQIARIPLKHLQELPSIPGNPFYHSEPPEAA